MCADSGLLDRVVWVRSRLELVAGRTKQCSLQVGRDFLDINNKNKTKQSAGTKTKRVGFRPAAGSR
jgi:hypothetical protein